MLRQGAEEFFPRGAGYSFGNVAEDFFTAPAFGDGSRDRFQSALEGFEVGKTESGEWMLRRRRR